MNLVDKNITINSEQLEWVDREGVITKETNGKYHLHIISGKVKVKFQFVGGWLSNNKESLEKGNSCDGYLFTGKRGIVDCKIKLIIN